jgi:hypothetical protein
MKELTVRMARTVASFAAARKGIAQPFPHISTSS